MLRHLPGDQLERFIAKVDQLLKGWDDHRSDTSAVRTETAKLQRSVTLLHGRTAQLGGSRREEDPTWEVKWRTGKLSDDTVRPITLADAARIVSEDED